MKQVNIKKLVIPNIPYFMIGLYASKLGEAWRLAEGADGLCQGTDELKEGAGALHTGA